MGRRPAKLTLCLMFAAPWASVVKACNSPREITIHVYSYSRVEPVELAEAEGRASRILGEAGIDTRWRHCTTSRPGLPRQPACDGAADGGTNLVLRILPEHMSRKIAAGSKQLGTSISTRVGVFPTDAYVFLDRVVHLTQESRTPWPALLGAAIAHEVGHLLLGNNSHFPVGIMRGQWDREEIKQILMGVFNFTPPQAEQMCADVGRRMNKN